MWRTTASDMTATAASSRIEQINLHLRGEDPQAIVAWGIEHAKGRAVVSTNFRPRAAVMLHLTTRVKRDIPVLWVDTGYNTAATYLFAETLIQRLGLNI